MKDKQIYIFIRNIYVKAKGLTTIKQAEIKEIINISKNHKTRCRKLHVHFQRWVLGLVCHLLTTSDLPLLQTRPRAEPSCCSRSTFR